MSKKKIKIGFIGTGGIAGTQISYLQKIDGVTVEAVADPSKDALKNAQEKYSIENTFTNWRDILKLRELDAISVCTPNKFHCEPTVAALKAGKHVLVEKPMAMNAKEAKKMVDTAKQKKKLLQIAFQWRFTPQAQCLRKHVESGQFGKILYVRVQALRRRGIPNWGVFGRKELQGGGPMIDIGVHLLEMAHYIIGSPKPATVRGSCYTYLGNKQSDTLSQWPNWDYKTYNVEDLAVGFLTFEDNSSLVIESSFAAHIEKDIFNVQIMGTKGGGTYEPLKIFTDQNGYMMNTEPAFTGEETNGFEFKMQHFVECIRDGKKCLAPGEDGFRVQEMLDGIYQSAETGKEIRFKI